MTRVRQEKLELHEDRTKYGQEYEPFVPGPNPKLPEFIKKHSTPYDPNTDDYDVKAFDRDIVVDKAAKPKAIYDMHTYWSKKHWAAIREYIRHYLPEKYYPKGTGLVLDCFSGSGMTGVAAMMEDRPCVLVDASPAAAFISHCYTHPVAPQELEEAYEEMMHAEYPKELRDKLKEIAGKDISNLTEELNWLYETKCDRCGGKATTEYVVYSEQFQCPQCGEVVALFDCPEKKVPYIVGSKKKPKTELKKRRVCPHCLKKYGEPQQGFVISTRTKKFGSVPVMISYVCEGDCKPKRDCRRHDDAKNTKKGKYWVEHDLGKIGVIEKAKIPHWVPDRKMMDVEDDSQPWGTEWRPGRNFRTIAELYTKRNLWALGAIKGQVKEQHLLLGITGTCLALSRMQRYSPTSGFPNMVMMGTYYIPQIGREHNTAGWYPGKISSVIKAQKALHSYDSASMQLTVSTLQDTIEKNKLDYVFTDPPYVGKVQYGELNFVWESWLGFDGRWLEDEIIVNPFRNKSLADWDSDMRSYMANCYTALKPGRWMSLCYHDTDAETWATIQNVILDTGFEIHTVTVLDPKQKSMNQLLAEKVVKSDLVINCRKPRPGESMGSGKDETSLVSHRVREILLDTLSATGSKTRDKLWDIVLKRLLTRGQMAEHRFDDILDEVAFKSESGHYFLKEEFESLSDNDIRNEEAAGAILMGFVRLRCTGVPVNMAAAIVLDRPELSQIGVDEEKIEKHIRANLLDDDKAKSSFKLGGRMRGCEFYDCLFFYLTRYLKGRASGKTPRRNLADFLEEYLVRFKDGDKWLYRPPEPSEAEILKKSRQSGLGRRVRQFSAFLRGEGEFPQEKIPDLKTLLAWLRHCAHFGLADEGVLLYEKGGLMGRLNELGEDERYDAEDYYSQCRRGASKSEAEDDENIESELEAEGD